LALQGTCIRSCPTRKRRAAGHQVAFATPPSTTSVLEELGFRAFGVGPDRSPREAVRLAGFSMAGRSIHEQNDLMGRYWVLGDHLIERVNDLTDLASVWRPDIVVRGEIEFGGCLAAERLGIPHASIKAFANADAREVPDQRSYMAKRLSALREQIGLTPDPDLEMPYRYLEVWPFPPSLREGSYPAPTCRPARPVPFDQSGSVGLPVWIDDLPPRADTPRVYITLGTSSTAARHTHLFGTMLAGLRDEGYSLIVTVGRAVDPSSLGPHEPEANVHVEQYIPQTLLLPHCDPLPWRLRNGSVRARPRLASGDDPDDLGPAAKRRLGDRRWLCCVTSCARGNPGVDADGCSDHRARSQLQVARPANPG
jgi:UDP:flavonoid glycosyltransferase YjiC (YdhE family)